MKKLIILIFLILSVVAKAEPEQCKDFLFYISKSHNKNVLFYAPQFNGSLLDETDPVHIYWIMHQEKGQIEDLTLLEKPQFGIKKEELEKGKSYIIRVRNNVMNNLPIYVAIDPDGCARAKIYINGRLAYFDSAHLEVHRKGLIYSVPYLDLYGHDFENGEEVSERLHSK